MKKLLSLAFICICSFAFSQISMTSTVTNVTCFGLCNGSASVTATGGTAPYTFWSTNGANAPIISNLCAGQYTVYVLDALSTKDSIAINITEPSPLTASVVVQNSITCAAYCSGYASLIVNGGTAPYSYSWSSGSTFIWSNLCAGVSIATVTDMQGCSTTQSLAITQSTATPIILTTTVTNATCQNSCNGSIAVNITGGVPVYTYTYHTSFSPWGFGGNNPNINAACVGGYTLVVYDAMGCGASAAIYVGTTNNNSIPNSTITSVSYNETCQLSGDGAIDVSIVGTNTGPFTYQWNNGANTQDVTNLISNIYSINIIDTIGNCFTLNDTITSIGINCGTISGNVYIDNNSDCVKNSGDIDFNNSSIIVNPGNRLGYTNTNGDYSINNLPYGTYTVTLTNLLSSCSQTLNTNVNSGTPNTVNNNLSASFNYTLQPDMNGSSYSTGIVPGFNCFMNYWIKNMNNYNGSGLLKVVIPSAFIPNITNVIPNMYSISADTLIWSFSNITYGSIQQFQVFFNVPNGIVLGSVFNSCMYIETSSLDVNPLNNIYCYSRLVSGSFDPNDKTVSPVGYGPNGDIAATETDLTYLIRFQNTGNGPAVNIVVKDTLSPNVDITTFEMLSASHNYNIDILPGNVIRWKFNNIMLADSGSNEPASHGYIQYRIKRNNNNTPGTQIKNTAYIYFDFNEPVVTNTAINTIETITNIKSQSFNENGWNVYPNPSTGALYIVNSTSVKEESKIEVINSIGQTVFEESTSSNYKNIDLSKLTNGVYFVKITSDKNSTVKRVVLSK